MADEFQQDDDLIRRAELWATGATIHNVKSLIGHYRAACEVLLAKPERPAQVVAFARAFAAWAHKTLTEFMAHGDYQKACRDNPLPPCDY